MADGEIIIKTKLDKSGVEKGLDELKDKAESKASGIGTAFKKLGGGVVTGLKAVGAAATTAVGAGVAAITSLTKSALDAAGELEQNIGGSEAVFGNFANRMQNTAAEAYKNMGLSQSEFLANANKMGSLLKGSGFGVYEAANIASDVMQRAADVASIMGLDVSAAMEAVTGAAKGNFTMMDNLGVAINDTTLKIYAEEKGLGELKTTQDKVSAAMQMFMEKTADYAGNYAKENATLAGSMTTLKAAWDNFLSGAGDVGQLIDSLSGVTEVISSNIMEIVPRLASALPEAIAQISPMIGPLVQQLLPPLVTAATGLISSLIPQLPGILQSVSAVIPTIVDAIFTAAPQLLTAAIEIIAQLGTGLGQALPTLIPQVVDIVIQLVNTLIGNAGLLIDAALALIVGLVDGIVNALPMIVEQGPVIISKLVEAIISHLPDILVAALKIILALADGLITNLPKLVLQIPRLIKSIVDGFAAGIKDFMNIGTQWVEGIKTGLENRWNNLVSKVKTLGADLLNEVKSLFGIASPSKKFKWIGEMCVAGLDEPLAEYNPYETVEKSFKASAPTLQASFAGGYSGFTMEYDTLGSQVANAMKGLGVYMDGRTVGSVIAGPVNDALGRITARRT